MIRKIKKAFLKRYGEIQKKHNKNVKKFDKLNLNSTYTFCSEHCAIRSNTALIESRSGEDLAGNMLRIAQGLQERNVKVYISVKEDSEEKIRAIARKAGLTKAKFVTIHTCRYYRILATAKYLFNDVSFTWRFIKRDDQVYTNTWHGTPLKCLGYDVPGDQYIMGNGQRNLLMADYLAVPNSFCGEHLIDAYHIRNLYHGKVLYSGYPRNQIFFDNEARARVRRELGLEQKKVYAYMPTWRGNHTEASDDFLPVLTAMLDSLDTGFSDEQILYVKLHNLTKSQLDLSGYRHIREFPAEYETYEFLNIADCLITDYSSVLFDFANTGAGIVLYVPDKEEYLRERGMYLSLDALPFPQAGTAEELLTALNSCREIRYPEFAATYCAYDNGNCTNRLLDHVMGIARTYEEETLPKPEKQNVMIFCSNVQIQDPITASLKNLLENLDSARFNYYFGFYRKNTPAECEFFRNVPKDISIFSISSPFYLTFIEQWAYDLQQKKHVFKKPVQKVLDRLYRRELKKLLVDAPFDVIVHFDGYGTQDTLPMFQQYPKKRIVLAHNNMKAKKHKRSKPDKAILKSAYSHYDQIVAVTPEAAKSVAALGAPKKKTVLLQGLSETGDSLKSAVMEFETLLID